MPIRTEDEYRSAQARLDGEKAIMRSRSFTDDEQRDFDALTAEIAAYEKGRSPSSNGAPSTPLPPVATPSATRPAAEPTVSSADLSASMNRELARQGLAQPKAGSASASMASMQREIGRVRQ